MAFTKTVKVLLFSFHRIHIGVKLLASMLSVCCSFSGPNHVLVLTDARAFVAQTHADMQTTKQAMSAEVEALNTKLQDVVKFIEKNTTQAAEVEESLKVMQTWCRENHLGSIPARMTATEARATEIVSESDRKFRELSGEISVTRSAIGSGGGLGGQGSAWVEKDRNVFDIRDYKLTDLGAKPTAARWKKWRRDFEQFVDSIGNSWKGTSGLLRQLRHCELPFNEDQIEGAVQKAKERGDKAPLREGYDYENKKDVLYRLLMPRLDDVLGNELAQSGVEDGYELFRPAPDNIYIYIYCIALRETLSKLPERSNVFHIRPNGMQQILSQ